jgi:hypothetical protein
VNLYDALGVTVARVGEAQGQAGRPCGERAKVAHGLCDHRMSRLRFTAALKCEGYSASELG